MVDRITRTTHQRYGNRISQSFMGILSAPILCLSGICLLAWNEGHFVTEHKAIDEGLRSVVRISSDTLDPSNEGHLVHFTGKAVTNDIIKDPDFGVAPGGILKLNRKVEMYQWVESKQSRTTKNTGGSTDTTTTFTYSKEWSTKSIHSSSFEEPRGHQNPGSMMFSDAAFEADPITVGAFTLSSVVTNKITWFRPLASTAVSTDTIPRNTAGSRAKPYPNGFYFGYSTTYPTVGDTKISYKEISEQLISVIAQQSGDTLSTFIASSGGSILLVDQGQYNAEDMFQHADDSLVLTTRLLRLVGFVVVFLSFQLLFGPLKVVADGIPFIGELVEVGNSCVSFLLAGVISAATIAVAWFANRPFISILFFVLLVGASVGLAHRQRSMIGGGGGGSESDGDDAIPIAHAVRIDEIQEVPDTQFKDEPFASRVVSSPPMIGEHELKKPHGDIYMTLSK